MEIKLETKMRLKMKVSVRKAAERIVQVLHEEEIPFSVFDATFKEVRSMAESYTVPYSPKALEAASLANCVSNEEEVQHGN